MSRCAKGDKLGRIFRPRKKSKFVCEEALRQLVIDEIDEGDKKKKKKCQ